MKDLEDQLTASVGAPNNDFDTLAAKYSGIPYSVYYSYITASESKYLQTILTDTTGVGSMLLRLAALTGRPIAYPLLAIRNAMGDQNLDPSDTFTVTELKAALQTLNSDKGPEKDFTSIAANVYAQAASKDPQLMAILAAMVPTIDVGTSTFVANPNSTWGTKPPPVGPPVDPGTVTPSGGDGGDSGGGGGGGGGGVGGGGTQPYVPEDKEPKSKPEEGSDWFIIIIVLLLLLGVGFAVTKRR